MPLKRTPTREDSYVMRICFALDVTPQKLAKALQIPFRELRPLLHGREGEIAEVDMDEVLWALHSYVGERIAYLLAIRAELDNKLQKDRINRVKRIERFRKYHGTEKTTKGSD